MSNINVLRNIFAISDPHWGHKNILKFTGLDGKLIRPEFSSVGEMDEHMVERWNSVVTDQDIIYCMGDVTMNIKHWSVNIAPRLRGKKRLLLGNHDDGENYELTRHFKKVRMWRIFKEDNIILSHFPLREDQFRHKVEYNGHGHIHERLVLDCNEMPDQRYINLCVERNNYTPVSLEEIKAKMMKLNQ